MGWQHERFGALDTETTGVRVESDRVVTVCTAEMSGDRPDHAAQALINPGVPIPAEATAVHGVTSEHAARYGQAPGEALTGVAAWLKLIWGRGKPVVAYNAAYDLTILDREFRRHLGHGLDLAGPVVDPFVIDRQVDPYRRGKRTLDVTCRLYGVALDNAHDATADALAAGNLAVAVADRHERIAAMSLEELHEAQIGWHAARQESFRAWLASKSEDTSDVSGVWPVRPYQNREN